MYDVHYFFCFSQKVILHYSFAEQIVPATLKRQTRPETARPRPTAPRSEGARPAEDRAAYRRAPGAASAGPDKKAEVGAGTADVEFVSSHILILSNDELVLETLESFKPSPVQTQLYLSLNYIC